MQKNIVKKGLTIAIILVFVAVSFQPVFAVDNKIRNVTIILDGEIGDNGIFVSCVNITFDYNPEEIDLIYYKLDSGDWSVYSEMFQVCKDGPHTIMWHCIDVNGTQSADEVLDFRIDKTDPEISLSYEVIGGNKFKGYTVVWTATANDETSGMDKVEFYFNGELRETVYGMGPIYQWTCYNFPIVGLKVRGIINNLEITEEYVEFFAVLVIILSIQDWHYTICANAYDNAGNIGEDCIHPPCSIITISPGIYLFKNIILPNNYTGYIGKYFMKATFDV